MATGRAVLVALRRPIGPPCFHTEAKGRHTLAGVRGQVGVVAIRVVAMVSQRLVNTFRAVSMCSVR